MGQVIRIKGLYTGDIGFGTVDNPNENLDADARAYLTLATGLSAAEKSAVNAFIVGLKSKNLWAKLSAVYPFLGTGQTGRGANLRNTSKNLTYSGYSASSENTKGWIAVNGMWAGTGLTDTWNNNYVGVYMSVKLGNSKVACNVSDTTKGIMSIITRSSGLMTAQVGNSSTNVDFPTNSGVGMFSVSTQSTSADAYYNNAKASVTKPTASTASEMQLMSYNSAAVVTPGSIMSIALLGAYLTEAEITSLNSEINTFLTAIGRI